MTDQSRRSMKIGIISLALAFVLALAFWLAVDAGWIDISAAGAAGPSIQDQGSSPYCLFAATAYVTGLDMWRLEAAYQQRRLPTVNGIIPSARPVIDLAAQLSGQKITIFRQWDTAAVQAAAQQQPVAVTGHGHALVLVGWKNGRITYLDRLHANSIHIMSDQEFWSWWDGWAWWLQ